MINREWERFGEEIRKTVQDAIDAQDFNQLNKTVSDTINGAVEGITKTIKNAGDTTASHARGYSYCKQAPAKESFKRKSVELYKSVTALKVGGTVMTAAGAVVGGSFFLFFFLMLLGVMFKGGFGLAEIIVLSIFFVLSAGGFGVSRWGAVLRGRVKRFQSYIRIMGQREYCNIRELAEGINKNVKYVLKDVERMLHRGWFIQGHLDEQKTCLIVSHNMYHQYLKLEDDRRKNIEEQRLKEIERQKEAEEQSLRLSPEVRKVIETGDDYIKKIHACNDAIPGEEISAKISRMETVIDRIFDRVERNPEMVDDVRRMMEYYLPTTIKLLEAYKELDSQPVDGDNIRSSKKEIENTLDTLSTAFEKLLDDLFQDTAWDVSTDISVLRTMLAQDGLTEDGLRK